MEGDWSVVRGAFFASVLSDERNAFAPWDARICGACSRTPASPIGPASTSRARANSFGRRCPASVETRAGSTTSTAGVRSRSGRRALRSSAWGAERHRLPWCAESVGLRGDNGPPRGSTKAKPRCFNDLPSVALLDELAFTASRSCVTTKLNGIGGGGYSRAPI